MVRRTAGIWKAATLASALAASGSASAMKTELDDCRKLSRSLQAETSQLKDDALRLRSANGDLSQRAVADARRIKALEEINEGYEQSIMAYQKERERLASDYDRISREIQARADRPESDSDDPSRRR